MPTPVRMSDGFQTYDVHPDDVAARQRDGWTVESAADTANRVGAAAEQDAYSNLEDRLQTYGGTAWSAATGGLSDAAMSAAGIDTHRLRKQREANPGLALAGTVVGGVAGAAGGIGPIGEAATLGARVARAGEGAGVLARVGRAAGGAAIEGAAQGFGEGISELALAEDPLNVEHAFSTLSSKTIYGAGIGAAAGTVAKSAELGLLKGKQALDEFTAKQGKALEVGDELASLDAKGLAAAEKVEKEALEAARVPQRQQLAEEIAAFRQELKSQKHAVLTKGVELPAVDGKLGGKELGKIALKANRQLDNILDNPVGLAKNPGKALDALQRQENALARLSERTDDLRAAFAGDTSGVRMAALDSVAPALERNRALQAKIAELASEASSPRLQQIAEAKLALQSGGGRSLAEQMAGGATYNAVTGALGMIPLPGMGFIAPMVGARASALVGDKVFGRLGKAMTEGKVRSAKALSKVFEVGARGAKAAPPIATRVLASVAFAPAGDAEDALPSGRARLPRLYKQRTLELREQVAIGPEGKAVVRPAARARIAEQLKPIAAMQPLLADRMETLAVRRLEFLADNMPKRPEIGGLPVGPDNWQPSELQMRAWARLVAAAEDPDGVLERVADGTITPEDAKVMRELYPEKLQEFTFGVLERLPTLRQNLPYHRRLALSVLTGVAVDPSMEPRILAALQAQYAVEPTPSMPKPQFGSVKNTEVGTPSERREARE